MGWNIWHNWCTSHSTVACSDVSVRWHSPQASTETNAVARSIDSLVAWNGKIYAGYGSWESANTGPMSVTPFNPATLSFAATPELVADTELVDIWHQAGGKLYSVHIDPHSHNGADYDTAEVIGGKAAWSNQYKMHMTHVFGMTSMTGNPAEMYLVGSRDEGSATNEVAKVYRTTDGGATWSESLSVPSRGGYNRMVFVAQYGGKVYAQNFSTTDTNGNGWQENAWVFDGSRWSKTTPFQVSTNGTRTAEFAGKLIFRASNQSLVSYDGRVTTTVLGSVTDYALGQDGFLYILSRQDSNLVVVRSKDLASWETVTVAPGQSTALAVLGSFIYVGTSDSKLYRADVSQHSNDTTPPQIMLSQPTEGTTISTWNEPLAIGSDDSAIKQVDFYAGSTLIGSTTGLSPDSTCSKAVPSLCPALPSSSQSYYSYVWSGKGIAAGTYPLTAVAHDIYGNSKTSLPINITVPAGLYPPDAQAPVVSVASPSSGSRIRKSVWLSASASDNESVSYIEASLDGVVVASSPGAWLRKDGVPVSKGTHTLVVTAKDASGNIGSSSLTFTSR